MVAGHSDPQGGRENDSRKQDAGPDPFQKLAHRKQWLSPGFEAEGERSFFWRGIHGMRLVGRSANPGRSERNAREANRRVWLPIERSGRDRRQWSRLFRG